MGIPKTLFCIFRIILSEGNSLCCGKREVGPDAIKTSDKGVTHLTSSTQVWVIVMLKTGLISSPKNDTPRVGGDYDVERYATFLRNDYTFH